jgi:hypothetical protein
MYLKKGFVTSDGSNLEQTLLKFYNEVYTVDENNVQKNIWGMGTGKAASAEEAYKLAYSDAIEEAPGLMMTYFQMWTMTKKAPPEELDQVRYAINNAEAAIKELCKNATYQVPVQLTRNDKGKTEIHLRTLTNQLDLRDKARMEIIKELKKATDWEEAKMVELLTFKK